MDDRFEAKEEDEKEELHFSSAFGQNENLSSVCRVGVRLSGQGGVNGFLCLCASRRVDMDGCEQVCMSVSMGGCVFTNAFQGCANVNVNGCLSLGAYRWVCAWADPRLPACMRVCVCERACFRMCVCVSSHAV